MSKKMGERTGENQWYEISSQLEKKAKAAFSKAVEEHDDLPHEFDAERLEAKVRELYGEGEKHPDDVCR